MDPNKSVSFLQGIGLFQNFTEAELKELLPYIQTLSFKAGAWVIQEGETGRELLVIKSGVAQALKKEPQFGEFQDLGLLKHGDYFGEMAHLENEKRSASVRVVEPLEVISFDLDALQQASHKEPLYAKIVGYLAKRVSQRLRRTSELLIDYFQDKLKMTQLYAQVAKMLVLLFIFMALWFNLSEVIALFPVYKNRLEPIFTPMLGLVYAACIWRVIKTSGYPLSFYGLTLNNWARYATQAALYSIPMMGGAVVLKWALIHYVDRLKDVPLLSLVDIQNRSHTILLYGVFYLISAPLQEFLARGGLQSCFRNFFQGPNRALLAILVSNLIFQMIHTIRNIWLALFSLLLGIYWGFVFEKQKSLVGVIFSHMIIGFFCLFILDLGKVFSLLVNHP